MLRSLTPLVYPQVKRCVLGCRDAGYLPPPIGFYTSVGLVNPTGCRRLYTSRWKPFGFNQWIELRQMPNPLLPAFGDLCTASCSRWIVHSQPTEDQKDSHNPTGGSRWIVHSQPLLLVVERTGRD